MDRRGFMGAMAAIAACSPLSAKSGKRAMGVQLFSIPKLLDGDLEAAIGFLARTGYREVETFGPYPFSDARNIARWKTITPGLGFTGSGFFGRSTKQFGEILRAHEMQAPSMHTDLDTLEGGMGRLAEAAAALGAAYVTLPSIHEGLRQSIDGYKRMADRFNLIGLSAQKHGVRFAYHNHGYGLKSTAGQIPLRVLLDSTDPNTVFLEMDVYWTIAGGADPTDYLSRYSGRYKMLHLKDMIGTHHFMGNGGTPAEWIPMFRYMTSLGRGTIALERIIRTADQHGAEHFFVEQDNVANAPAALLGSAAYLRKNGFR